MSIYEMEFYADLALMYVGAIHTYSQPLSVSISALIHMHACMHACTQIHTHTYTLQVGTDNLNVGS